MLGVSHADKHNMRPYVRMCTSMCDEVVTYVDLFQFHEPHTVTVLLGSLVLLHTFMSCHTMGLATSLFLDECEYYGQIYE